MFDISFLCATPFAPQSPVVRPALLKSSATAHQPGTLKPEVIFIDDIRLTSHQRIKVQNYLFYTGFW